MKKVILLATNHKIQEGERLTDEYLKLIKDLIEKYDIKSIYEEIKDDVKYITEKFCKENSIPHKIIEPNKVEKEILNIEEAHKLAYRIQNIYDLPSPEPDTFEGEAKDDYQNQLSEIDREREKEWLKRIVELDTYPSLVIFGADHLAEFSKLLEKNEIEIVHQEKFGVEE